MAGKSVEAVNGVFCLAQRRRGDAEIAERLMRRSRFHAFTMSLKSKGAMINCASRNDFLRPLRNLCASALNQIRSQNFVKEQGEGRGKFKPPPPYLFASLTLWVRIRRVGNVKKAGRKEGGSLWPDPFFPFRLFYNMNYAIRGRAVADESKPSEEQEILDIDRTDYFKIGIRLTAVFGFLAATYVVVEWDAIYLLKPNEFGDFLAGVFGPLFLLWVVMGFLQQGAELKYSREALLLQAKELKASVEAQKNMGEAAWETVKVERAAQENARLQRVLALEPKLVLHQGHVDTNDRPGVRNLSYEKLEHYRISNMGATCLSLDISIDCSARELGLSGGFFDRVDTGREVECRVIDRNSMDLCEYDIVATYRNVEGERFGCRFAMILQNDILRVRDEFGTVTPT